MIRLITSILLLSSFFISAQNSINADNYYSHHKGFRDVKVQKLSTAWLDKFEAAAILKDEMEKAGFEWLSTFQIINISDKDYVVSICFSEKSKFGFVYEGIHMANPDINNRSVKSLSKASHGYDYSEKIINANGESQFVKITELPTNLFIIKEDIYWYQFSENDKVNKTMVTKDIMLEIFRQDIKNVLKSIKAN